MIPLTFGMQISSAEATKGLDTTTVFAFGLPSWGVLTMRDNVGETSGLWGVCSGPAAGFDGGTISVFLLSLKEKTQLGNS